MSHTSRSINIKINGVSKNAIEWAEIMNVSSGNVHTWIKRGSKRRIIFVFEYYLSYNIESIEVLKGAIVKK